MDNININQDISDTAWKIGQHQAIAQENHIERIDEDSRFLSSTGSFDDFVEKAEGLINSKTDIQTAFGGSENANKQIDAGLEAYSRGFIYGKISRGELIEAQSLISSGQLDSFIDDKTKSQLAKKYRKHVKAKKNKMHLSKQHKHLRRQQIV